MENKLDFSHYPHTFSEQPLIEIKTCLSKNPWLIYKFNEKLILVKVDQVKVTDTQNLQLILNGGLFFTLNVKTNKFLGGTQDVIFVELIDLPKHCLPEYTNFQVIMMNILEKYGAEDLKLTLIFEDKQKITVDTSNIEQCYSPYKNKERSHSFFMLTADNDENNFANQLLLNKDGFVVENKGYLNLNPVSTIHLNLE